MSAVIETGAEGFRMEIVLMFLIAFGIVGSVEARMRVLLRRHERHLDAAREDLARVERKLDGLLRHSGLFGAQGADSPPPASATNPA